MRVPANKYAEFGIPEPFRTLVAFKAFPA